MQLLYAGVDTSVIALWLGHEGVATTQIYLHADLALKEKAIARTTPPKPRFCRVAGYRHLPLLAQALELHASRLEEATARAS